MSDTQNDSQNGSYKAGSLSDTISLFIVAGVVVLIILCCIGMCSGGFGSSSSSSKKTLKCPVCERTFSQGTDDYKSIKYNNMCSNCYNNYKWLQNQGQVKNRSRLFKEKGGGNMMICPVCGEEYDERNQCIGDNGNPICPKCFEEENQNDSTDSQNTAKEK